jgi:DNA polymerase-3 subunit delta'
MSFAQHTEQTAVVDILRRSLDRQRLGHAYLFAGPHVNTLEAVSKTLAKTLFCLHPPQRNEQGAALDCCDQCDPCHRVDENTHPDVLWIRPESKMRVITIDQIRDLMGNIRLKTMDGGYKLGIIVGADRLNVQAANAFLKTLEEPPPRSLFLLLSSTPSRVMETIRSRCLTLNFAGASRPQYEAPVLSWLEQFSATAAQTQTGLLNRYRLLGALLEVLTQTRETITEQLTAASPLQSADDADPVWREKLETELNAAIEAEYRNQRAQLMGALQWWLRDVWLTSLGADPGLNAFPNLQEHTQNVAQRLHPDDAAENLKTTQHSLRLLETNAQEALVLETTLLKLKV